MSDLYKIQVWSQGKNYWYINSKDEFKTNKEAFKDYNANGGDEVSPSGVHNEYIPFKISYYTNIYKLFENLIPRIRCLEPSGIAILLKYDINTKNYEERVKVRFYSDKKDKVKLYGVTF